MSSMSIRLRLTLLYSAILALTLIIFSTVLYFGHAQATFRDYQRRLADRAGAVAGREQPPLPVGGGGPLPPPAGGPLPPPSPRESFYVQIRNPEGEVIEYDPSLGDTVVLPLSDAGLQAVRRGRPWDEIVWIEEERFLIHSQLIRGPDGIPRVVQVAGSLTRRDRDLNTLRNILILGSSMTVIVAFGIGWLLASLALRPIHRLTQTTQAIGARRDFGRRIDHTGPDDEIGQLATTFNDMLTKLQAAYQQVGQSLQAQRRFVADASHELRTPLTTIRGNIGLLQREPPISDEDRVDVLTDMVNETERLMRLVNDLLVLARADAERPLPSEPIPVKPLIEDVHSQVKRLAPHRKIVNDSQLEVAVMGNRDALKQVLLILLDNAIKHTPPETTIAITTAIVDESMAISVRDNGPGIQPARLPHIFDRFYRGDAVRTGGGVGLGLAIAKELTEAQNGTLTVQSQVGQGSVFTLILPIR
jgi:two-component system OmpR family sensor kinase